MSLLKKGKIDIEYETYLNDMDESYLKNNSISRIVIDYIAGMTDNFFNYQYQKYFGK